MPTGTATLTASAQAPARIAITLDESVGLARVSVDWVNSPLDLSTSLNASALYDLLGDGSRVLERMYELGGIGITTLDDRHSAEIDRVAHALSTKPRLRRTTPMPPGLPPADTPKHELHRLALAEMAKFKEARRRGDFG